MSSSPLFTGKWIQCQKRQDCIAEVVFSTQESSVNKFNQATLNELKQVISILHSNTEIKGVLFTSTKDVFIVGADITEFKDTFTAPVEDIIKWLMQTHHIFNAIEDLNVPTVAAINGICLGGGFELALSTSLRVVSKNALLGLPEVKLGIFPGWGGCIRLPRLIGIDNAIEWIAGGDRYKADKALKVGAVDAVAENNDLHAVALSTLKAAIANEIDWKEKTQEKKSPLKLVSPVETLMSLETSKAFVFQKAGTHYPAPLAAIKVIEKTSHMKRDDALNIEAKGFAEIAKSPQAESLVSIFLSDQYNKKLNKKYIQTDCNISSAAVVGAGIMGGGIAYQSASSKIPIYMKDINSKALSLGLKEASSLLAKQHKRGKISTEAVATTMGSITATLSYGDFSNVDIVVEAVVENPKVKKTVLSEIEKASQESTILTSNTSTISINYLAEELKRPENFCGMHFFNPVHRMPLVEIIRGEKTSEQTLGKTIAYALKMKKTPIVVNDCPGFLVNRVLFPYFHGLIELLKDGASFVKVDQVMEKFGWPMGPAYLLDVIGIDTALHATSIMANAYPDRMASKETSVLNHLFDAKRLGQKTGKGFYEYSLNKKGKLQKQVSESLDSIMGSKQEIDHDFEEIIDRMMLPMIFESARCLEEKIVSSPMEVDLGVIYGLGFPPFLGGVLKYADSVGIQNICEKAKKYSAIGNCYKAPQIMIDLARKSKKFYQL